MGLIRVGALGQEPNAFDDRDRVVSRRDTADAHLSHQYHQINV